MAYDWRWHEIWHGESQDEVGVLQDEMIDCIITDPPFGTDNQSNQSKTAEGKEHARKIANDETPEQAIATFKTVFDATMPKVKPDAHILIFTSGQVLADWIKMTEEYLGAFGWERKGIVVWDKDYPGMGDTNWPWGNAIEYILTFEGPTKRNKRTDRTNGVLRYPRIKSDKLIHPHEKPAPLLQRLAKASTDPGDFLFDPFGGSGSLPRAMRPIDRSALAIEMDEKNYRKATQAMEDESHTLF